MPSATLTDRIAKVAEAMEAEFNPSLPPELLRGRADRFASRAVESLRAYVSELEAESSSQQNWPRAEALADLFAAMSP